ncbi:unnamed protein product, partial [Bubo scandiacus]
VPLSHRCVTLPAFQMAVGFLTRSLISLSPLRFHFNATLSHLFFSSWMMCRSTRCNASSRGYQPAAPVTVSDLPSPEVPPCNESLMLWCA